MRKKKNVKKGIQFCLMVCGATGTGMYMLDAGDFPFRVVPSRKARLTSNTFTGRTTFVNTLCSKGVLNHKDSDDPNDAHVEEGVKIKPLTVGPLVPISLGRSRNLTRVLIALQNWSWTRRAPASP